MLTTFSSQSQSLSLSHLSIYLYLSSVKMFMCWIIFKKKTVIASTLYLVYFCVTSTQRSKFCIFLIFSLYMLPYLLSFMLASTNSIFYTHIAS